MSLEAPAREGPQTLPPLQRLTPLVANRTVATYLVVYTAAQLLIAQYLGWSIGLILLVSGLIGVAAVATLFRDAFAELRRSTRWRTPPDLLVMLGAFALGFIASRGAGVFVQAVWPGSTEALQNYNLQFTLGGDAVWIVLLAGGLLIPFAEELIFRGFLLTGYEQRRSPLVSALLTSALFALVHGLPAQALVVLPLGWVIARAVQFSGSFWTGVLIHAANNSLALGLAALLVANDALKPMLETQGAQSIPLAGGLVALFMMALALAVAWVWLRPGARFPVRPGPVWSGSLLVPLLVFALAATEGRFVQLFNEFARG